MRILTIIVLGGLLALGSTTCEAAEQAQAREVARLNNCLPKKVEVYQNSLGAEGKTIYRIQCNVPKSTGDTTVPAQDTLLIACASSLCEIVRPTTFEKK